MKRLGPGLVAFTLMATAAAPAFAADIPVGPSYYPPAAFPPPAVYNWAGIYFGANAGVDLLSDSASQAASGTLNGSASIHPAGVVGGGQAGVNFQFSSLLVGAEATWSSTNLSGSTIVGLTPAAVAAVAGTPTPFTSERFTSAPAWFGTATAKLGYAENDILFYVKAGAAWMHVTYTEDTLNASSIVTTTQALSDNRFGVTAGVGLEYGLTEHLSGRLEYDFMDFGTKSYNFAVTPASFRSDLNLLALGLDYRFDWPGGGPVLVKY